jgi:hypothetical protein
MAGIGLNPRYGYDNRPPYLQGGDAFIYGYGPPAYDAYIPQAPPGYMWVDIGGGGAIPLQPAPYCIPGNMPFMNQYPYGPCCLNPPIGAFNGPIPDHGFPGINFKNIHGGLDMEDGYNYIFPSEHCKIHVIVSRRPPWENASCPWEKKCFNVPTGITVKELMQGFGCTNPDPAKNCLTEVSQGADGTWYKGITVKGSEEKQMKKRIEEIGWNAKRNGQDQDFVWLYFTKD